jgi:prepilin-type N-terminal cleavage/methylation domain-containing protein/prepilin-type processing-associated H-X9-DG protein
MNMRRQISGFTLIELLASIAIMAMLIGLMVPNLRKVGEKAASVKCLNNLRQIGVSVNLYAADNDGKFPMVESMPSNQVYTDEGVSAKPLYETLSPYGLDKETLKCPADIKGPNYFTKEGSSYMWRNWVDDEKIDAVKFYGRRGVRTPNSAWIVITTDYDIVHAGHSNRLYADGHVKQADDTKR